MIIHSPEIIERGATLIYQSKIESKIGLKTLWYEIDAKYGDMLCTSSCAALLGLLIPAMYFGEDIYLKGAVSRRLFNNLATKYQNVVIDVLPRLRPVRIFAEGLLEEDYAGSGVATGFSAGVDSYCALVDYFFNHEEDGNKITHLLYNNVGSHGVAGERLFSERYDAIKSVPDMLGLPFIKINSNLDEFYSHSKYLRFIKTHTPRNVSAALVLQGGLKSYLYASTYSERNISLTNKNDIARVDSISLPLLSTDSLESISVGGEYRRVEKTEIISKYEVTHSILDVCVNETDGKNCSSCRKCMRTMLSLDIAGVLGNYANVFDFNKYKSKKTSYIGKILNDREIFSTEIIEFAKHKNFKFPFYSYIFSAFYSPIRRIQEAFKKN